ncbi:hypothetical protein SH580_04285 [Coraliomargarita algicola]|uniref:PEP-CTERM sorting domain-containing protein n=1 Tax=Coraliomargarita algicola TaxID=3092156 RepID=A0ABZ0RNW8_9BACT|nr:hypothetical protein [Coraliomargarita sp. J2-16]WPJ96924.1 hypothetical protein SH580_04285 [Coraliomargarita sp. J2-16]
MTTKTIPASIYKTFTRASLLAVVSLWASASSADTVTWIGVDHGSVNSITINDNGGASGTLNLRLDGVSTFSIGAAISRFSFAL